jgi:hypothetical protein
MSKKKPKKTYNNLTNYSNFIDNCKELFINWNLEDRKYEKCLKLIEDAKKINEPKEKRYAFGYYFNLGELYYNISKIKSKKYKLSIDGMFDVNAILEEENREYVDEILKDKELAFDNYTKSFKIITEIMKTNQSQDDTYNYIVAYNRNEEQLRIISQDLSNIYYVIDEEENFLLYGKVSIEYGSINVMSVFMKYYCDKSDYENASIYYDLINNYNLGHYNIDNKYMIFLIKINSYKMYYNFLYNLGMYEESVNVAQDFKKYIVNIEENMLNESKYGKNDFLKTINKHIEKCKIQIENSKNIKYKEDILLEYFDKEILNLMSDDNKVYILTSLNIYEYIKSQEVTMDYSSTLMPILKAIENIMFEIIAEKYHTFIIKKANVNKKYIKGFLNEDNEISMKIDRLEYGQALKLIGYRHFENNEIIPNKYFNEFCNENNIINSRDVIIKIYNELDELRYKRNLVAHKNRVYEECVKECYDILLKNIKFIDFLYTNFKFVFENKTKEK